MKARRAATDTGATIGERAAQLAPLDPLGDHHPAACAKRRASTTHKSQVPTLFNRGPVYQRNDSIFSVAVSK